VLTGRPASAPPPAQGEDVVAGIRTPEPISRLAETLPEAYEQLVANCSILEKHYKDMQVGVCVWEALQARCRHC
jgi:hypothetical protein